ncbi:MAG: hypothetical protein A3G33_06415 [Omnitrophica bacterium RIFCSPLOWO2_12_FULL_44_17]|uniref:Undecaprenyl-diphosphatase n=1 Tax=Candidatus Danuiimicrobium aquiferis TaxID=1801832 RepID=A0A1G1L1H5_9BACT|nr:MAG: hypothetical protein A3B72_01785 [Omnitrophica bacterium RIFCSPHIGHO2_02_FULL_45_28]OGW99010.1 MAG: hypothetical protein A3G33_06415 [Omnitrophica bacterium RIFCSPLOWO2_12_FULL_44_17]OGX04189.1 MAG: hypothetical protein A3J12_03350 [Omnitrophica bacterium RIFCSPLOWO2_02_FULL_44_11]
MTIIQAIILGIVQGLTEFLPVSSSAHLIIIQRFMELKGPILLVFDVVVHLGTLGAIVIFFAKAIFPLSKLGIRMFLLIVVASIPTALIGFGLKDWVESLFSTVRLVGFALLVNSMILWSTRWCKDRCSRELKSWLDALWIGIIQGIAVTPGISRSGSTISAALWRGIRAEDAFKFSFLIAIPAILGATVVVIPESIELMPQGVLPVMVTGFVSAFISGFIALRCLSRIVIKGQFHHFAWYTLVIGIIAIIFS